MASAVRRVAGGGRQAFGFPLYQRSAFHADWKTKPGKYIGIFLSPKNFSIFSSDPENYRDQNLPFRKFQTEKRPPKILGDLFSIKIR